MFPYDPAAIILTVGPQTITGYAEGSFAKAGRNEDGFSASWGADGKATRARNRNRGGRFTFTLAAGSPANDFLSSLAAEDELLGTGIRAVMIKDLLGTTLASAEKAWVVKYPDSEYSKDPNGSREWILECEAMEVLVGGAPEV